MQIHNHKFKPSRAEGGFTLIEVLVSLALFTIVVTMSVGTLLILIDTNSKAQNMQSVMTNLGYALDSMTRDIRTGTYYQCSSNLTLTTGSKTISNCSSGGSAFAFTESGASLTGVAGGRIGFQLNNGRIERNLANNGWSPITPSDVTINTLDFVVTGTDPADPYAPTVTIFISGTANLGSGQTSDTFELQTTITQQQVDV